MAVSPYKTHWSGTKNFISLAGLCILLMQLRIARNVNKFYI